MLEEDEQSERTDDRDVIERIEFLDMRIATQLERLEGRVRELESQLRSMKDSGDADLRRLRNLGARVFSRKKSVTNSQDDWTQDKKRFPIAMRHTSIGLVIVTGIETAIRSSDNSASGAELLDRWFGTFLFSWSWPAIVAYAVAGRKGQWSRNDRWFFWGSVIAALWITILTLQTVR